MTWFPPPTVGRNVRDRARELLADGQWHDFEEIIMELVKVVPPAIAIRKAEVNRIKGGSKTPERVKEFETRRLIDSGKRSIARESLRDTRGKSEFEIQPTGVGGRRHHKIPRQIRWIHEQDNQETGHRTS